MKGILVADDQEAVRLDTIKVIQKMDLDLRPVFQASDGAEALKIIQVHKPEIALVDIVMPCITGLDLIEQIKQGNYDTHFIIVSSYNDFEYAKKAINFKVDAYVLKPVSEKELQGVLISTMENIKKEDVEDKKFKEKEVQYYRKLLYDYISGRDSFIDMKKLDDGMCILSFKYQYFLAILIRFQDFCLEPIQRVSRNLETRLAEVDCRCLALDESNRGSLFLVNIESTGDRVHNVLEKVLQDTMLAFQCGVSEYKTGIGSLRELYKQANYAARECIPDRNQICSFSEFSDIQGHFLSVDEMGKLLDIIKNSREVELEKYLDHIFLKMTKERWHASNVENALQDLMDLLFINLKNIYPEAYEIAIAKSNLKEARDIFHMKIAVREAIDSIMHVIKGKNQKDSISITMEQITQYVANNYTQSISLSYITNRLNMNYNYISGLFAKKMGLPFSEYLLKIRLENAKDLLLQTDKKIYEVAAESGFNEVQYFCRAFKKQFTMTPAQFRDNMQNTLYLK